MIEKVEFEVGSEKRFLEFVRNLRKNGEKVALISDSDLDGVAAAKVANEFLKADFLRFGNHSMSLDIADELRDKDVKKVIMLDMSPNPELLDKLKDFAELLIIDHHQFQTDLNSERVVFMNCGGNNNYCAAYLSYYLFSKLLDLEKFDWLVVCACISDWAHENVKDFMKRVFEKYEDTYEADGKFIRKSGKFWDLMQMINNGIIYYQSDLGKVYNGISGNLENLENLNEKSEIVEDYIKSCLAKFDEEKEIINGRIYWDMGDLKFQVGAVLSTILSVKYLDETIILSRNRDEMIVFSLRNQNSKEDVSKLAKYLVNGLEDSSGGGHIPAAGASFMKKDKKVVLKRLRELKEI